MSTPFAFTLPVVLSPGAWQHVIGRTDTCGTETDAAQRLTALLRHTLHLTGRRALRRPLEFDLDQPSDHPQPAHHLQVARIHPPSEPAFLQIRLSSETCAST